MIDISKLKFDEKGLIPAIVVDAVTKRVLTLAYMNRESLAISPLRSPMDTSPKWKIEAARPASTLG